MSTLKPVVKEYTSTDELEVDINTLKDQGVSIQDIYILAKNSDYITSLINNTHATGIIYDQIDNINSFKDKNKNLKVKLETLDFSNNEIDSYEKSIFENKIFLIVSDFRIKGIL